MTNGPSHHRATEKPAEVSLAKITTELRADLSASLPVLERIEQRCVSALAKRPESADGDFQVIGALREYARATSEAMTALIAGDTAGYRSAISYAHTCALLTNHLLEEHKSYQHSAHEARKMLPRTLLDTLAALANCASAGDLVLPGTSQCTGKKGKIEAHSRIVVTEILDRYA